MSHDFVYIPFYIARHMIDRAERWKRIIVILRVRCVPKKSYDYEQDNVERVRGRS